MKCYLTVILNCTILMISDAEHFFIYLLVIYMSSAYLRLLIFLPAILIPACASSSPEFLMMHSAYKLNKQDDNKQP